MRQFVIKSGRYAAALLLSIATIAGASAADAVIPTTGLDMGSYVTAGITALAAVIGIVVGGYFAFLIIKKAMTWAGKALG